MQRWQRGRGQKLRSHGRVKCVELWGAGNKLKDIRLLLSLLGHYSIWAPAWTQSPSVFHLNDWNCLPVSSQMSLLGPKSDHVNPPHKMFQGSQFIQNKTQPKSWPCLTRLYIIFSYPKEIRTQAWMAWLHELPPGPWQSSKPDFSNMGWCRRGESVSAQSLETHTPGLWY